MKIWKPFLVAALTSVAIAASSLEESSRELAKEIAPSLAGKTVAVLDFLDQKKQVRELGRVIADQYLRVDLSRMGVKMVTRSALDKALAEIKLSQAGLTEAVSSGGLGNKFKAADVIVTGSLSQIGDTYTAATEAIDVKTGASIGLSRATFPKTSSYQALWDSVVEVPVVQVSATPDSGTETVSTTALIPNPEKPGEKLLTNGEEVKTKNFTLNVQVSFEDDMAYFFLYMTNETQFPQAIELDLKNVKIYDNNNKIHTFGLSCSDNFYSSTLFEKNTTKYIVRRGASFGMCFNVKRDLFDNNQTTFFLNFSESKYLNINQTWAREIGK
jgi:enoyl-[acyl-carrier-protein] reductase (NADH)